MKKYEKPCLTAITLSGNDQLCGSCADNGGLKLCDPSNEWIANIILQGATAGDNDGIVEKSDFANLFGNEDECKGPGMVQFESACKFSSTGGWLVAWS